MKQIFSALFFAVITLSSTTFADCTKECDDGMDKCVKHCEKNEPGVKACMDHCDKEFGHPQCDEACEKGQGHGDRDNDRDRDDDRDNNPSHN